jgi:glycosyltransferase involved in cell wall biosynthesis
MRAERPDVVISYTIKPVILGALAARAERVPRVVSLITGAGYALTGGREFKRIVSRMVARTLYMFALRRSDIVIFQNPDDEALFRGLGLVPKSHATARVNGSGIDLDWFRPVPQPPGASFLMIARLLKDKGIREFACAAKRLKETHPDVPIALVGYLDPSPDSIKQADVDELVCSGIDFKGPLDDVRPAICDASVFVLPSYREGTPRSVLEAMAMGRAIITTDAPGCRETVLDEETGLLIAVRDAEALYRAMLRFVDEPTLAQRMGLAARRLAEERFDVHEVNDKILAHAGL